MANNDLYCTVGAYKKEALNLDSVKGLLVCSRTHCLAWQVHDNDVRRSHTRPVEKSLDPHEEHTA